MQDQDKVGTSDAVLRELLASVAEHTHDPANKAFVLDFLLTMEPLAEWPEPALDALSQTCGYVISLARMSRALERLSGQDSRAALPDRSRNRRNGSEPTPQRPLVDLPRMSVPTAIFVGWICPPCLS